MIKTIARITKELVAQAMNIDDLDILRNVPVTSFGVGALVAPAVASSAVTSETSVIVSITESNSISNSSEVRVV